MHVHQLFFDRKNENFNNLWKTKVSDTNPRCYYRLVLPRKPILKKPTYTDPRTVTNHQHHSNTWRNRLCEAILPPTLSIPYHKEDEPARRRSRLCSVCRRARRAARAAAGSACGQALHIEETPIPRCMGARRVFS